MCWKQESLPLFVVIVLFRYFFTFTPARTRVFQVPSLPTARDGWRCAESFESDSLLVQGRNDLPTARYNAATRGRLAFPCLLTRRTPSLRSFPYHGPACPGYLHICWYFSLHFWNPFPQATRTRIYTDSQAPCILHELLGLQGDATW